MGIFLDNAPSYWGAGLPVIPLKRHDSPGKGAGKAPILNEWTSYAVQMPSKAMQDHWLVAYPESNIGLPFGDASGLCAIDIDTEDDQLIAAIRDVLPASPWVRVGKKGMGLIYRWHGQPNFKLRNNENQSIVEFLGKGNQMVMPPSIHPDTHKPYVSDTNLWEVLDQIQPLPQELERVLRAALEPILGAKGFTLSQAGRSGPIDVIPQGERDIQMVRHAGYLSRVVRGIDKAQSFTLKEAMEHMRHWVETFTAHSAGGDDMDPDKGVAKLIEFLLKDVEGGNTLPNGWDTGLTDEQRAHPAIAEMISKNASQRWTFSKAREWLEAQSLEMAQTDHDVDWMLDQIQTLVNLVAKDENFADSQFTLLVDPINKALMGTGVKMSKPDLLKSFKVARKSDTEMAADHEAIARTAVDELSRGGELKYFQGSFWQWGGSCFSLRDNDDIYMHIAEGVKGNVLARRHGDYEALTKTVAKMCRGELAQQMDVGINFANGFLDTDLQMHDHSPKYGKTFTMPFNYVRERASEAHKWLEYLEQSWGDDEDYFDKVNALQEAFAATMFGLAPDFQRAFLLHGKAKTGKSQALEVLRAMMPPAATSSVPPTVWGERFQLAPMVGKTLNICGELPEESTIDGRAFKEVIEGTPQNTEFKGAAIFPFKPMAAHWFASNFLPRSRDTSDGFTRRWLIFDFNRIVPAEERVLNFHNMLVAEEREAIAAWAVEGLKRLMDQREYTLPLSHKHRINQVTRANNSVAAFLQSSDKVRPAPGEYGDVRNIFDQYVFYMRDVSRGFNVSYERFMQMLDGLGFECELVNQHGMLRHRAKGLKVESVMLPSKPSM